MSEAEKAEITRALHEAGGFKVAPLGPVRLYECPVRWIAPETNDMLQALSLVEQGHLLWPGGWADQPAWLIEAQGVYQRELHAWTEMKKPKN